MVEQIGSIDVNASFDQQSHIKNFLNARYKGPVPEGLMSRLHSLTKQAIQQELDRLGLDMKCSGIRLGYSLLEVSEQPVERKENFPEVKPEQYYIECWGCYTQRQALLHHLSSGDDNTSSFIEEEDDILESFISLEFLDSLSSRLEEEMSSQISLELGNKSIQPWLSGYAQSNKAFSFKRPISFASSKSVCCEDGNLAHRNTGSSQYTGRCPTRDKPTDT